jgi:ubiquinone/menaquinone biosynthesis C-methylase UbiE
MGEDDPTLPRDGFKIRMINLFEFIKVARNRFNSSEDYVKFQRFQGYQIIERFNLIKEALRGKKVLDLGSGHSGYTGYSLELAKFAETVYALDLNISGHLPDNGNIILIKADALELPFKENTFDFCFCSSFIEHVENKKKVLEEIRRVLMHGSLCYLSFPPFYSPVGGHQFKPFHYLPQKMCLSLCNKIKKMEYDSYSSSFGNWGLYPTTIKQVKHLVREVDFVIESITTRFVPLNFARIPFINEFLTWHVEFILRKN